MMIWKYLQTAVCTVGNCGQLGSETAAFRMDNESGSYRKVEDYAGTIALFILPLDTTKADPAAAEEYLKKFLKKLRQELRQELRQQIRKELPAEQKSA